MKSKIAEILMASAMMGGGLPEVKFSAKDKRSFSDRKPKNPPRSMTAEELEYFQKHKNLNGFKPHTNE